MGKQSSVVKPRVCLNCSQTIETDSNGMRKHFIACCKESREKEAAS